jgi:hypothetical protein
VSVVFLMMQNCWVVQKSKAAHSSSRREVPVTLRVVTRIVPVCYYRCHSDSSAIRVSCRTIQYNTIQYAALFTATVRGSAGTYKGECSDSAGNCCKYILEVIIMTVT